jgi:hypothetical protein
VYSTTTLCTHSNGPTVLLEYVYEIQTSHRVISFGSSKNPQNKNNNNISFLTLEIYSRVTVCILSRTKLFKYSIYMQKKEMIKADLYKV